MITSFKQLTDGQMEIHSFCAFSSSNPKIKSSRHKFDLAATRPMPNAPISDGRSLYNGDPIPDLSNDAGASYCSMYALCRSAGLPESGFARDQIAKGAITPDATINGVPHWKAGDSANAAARKLKSSFTAAQAAKQPTNGSVGCFVPSL